MGRVVLLPPRDEFHPDGAKAGGWWHDSDEPDRLVCDLCPRECSLRPGDRGFCFVRENRGGQMVLTTYGRSTGFCIDPIEKKPLNHFYPGTSVLSFGTAGCNLGCKFCQNHDISKAREVALLSEAATPETIARAADELGCRSVAFTYNDPVIWAEYAIDTARACRDRGLQSVAVTAGYITPQAREPFFELFNAANVDLKAFTEDFYQHQTLSHLQPVLDTLAWLKAETDVWLEITNLIIPQANDSPDEIRRMCDWLLAHVGDDTPVHFSAFHPDYKLLDRARTPHETLIAAHDLAKSAGLRYVYVGNVQDTERQSTYCGACGGLLVQRDQYRLGAYLLQGDRCGHCGHPIPGRFADRPGDWGARRQPVKIGQFSEPTGSKVAAHGPVVSITQPGESPVILPDSSTADATPDLPENLELNDPQRAEIHRAASLVLSRTVAGTAAGEPGNLAGAGDLAVLGCYVSVKRRGRLRSCCGFIGTRTPLAMAVSLAATRSATEDPRLPPISSSELAHLDLETWLLYGLELVEACGSDRVEQVVVGRHGLHIARGDRRGLLLPGVATDHDWDAQEFLVQVCKKAGLPSTAWRDEETQLSRFAGLSVSGPLVLPALSDDPAQRRPWFGPDEFGAPVQFCRDNLGYLMRGAMPSYYLPEVEDGMVNAAVIGLRLPGRDESVQLAQFSIRPGLPMQSNLYSLAEGAARLLQSQGLTVEDLDRVSLEVTLLRDAAMHGTVQDPDLRGYDPRSRAIMVVEHNRSAWLFSSQQNAEELLSEVASRAEVTHRDAAQIYSFEARTSSAEPVLIAHVPRAVAGPAVRPPAVAGRFYPGEADALAREIDRLCHDSSELQPKRWRAALVPHAGWRYSGQIAADVISRIEIPERVIVIGPKHTAAGVEWAVAPHESWSLPGMEIASDPALAKRLAEAVPRLQCDALAHRDEHAIEVELPLLHRQAPAAKVVGIALGAGRLEDCQEFARALAETLQELDSDVLLLISSDMNHFAEDQENRRLDELALQALDDCDPVRLYHTVRDHGISMCGVLPAVIVLETLRRMNQLHSSQRVGYATTADVTGDTSRVVGYAGLLFS